MKIITTINEMQDYSDRLRDQGDRIGFVPTMGFLHEGHLSLMRQARDDNHALVVSIFVNPTQFGPREGIDTYPRDLEGDLESLKKLGVHAVFSPEADEMFPSGYRSYVTVEDLSRRLCGRRHGVHVWTI